MPKEVIKQVENIPFNNYVNIMTPQYPQKGMTITNKLYKLQNRYPYFSISVFIETWLQAMDGENKIGIYTYFDFRICIWKVIRMKSSDDKNPGLIVLCRVTINVPMSSQ